MTDPTPERCQCHASWKVKGGHRPGCPQHAARIARTTELCGMCSEHRDDVDEYTGVPGPVCKDCYGEWLEGQRENPEW